MIAENRFVTTLYDATYGRFIFARLYDWFFRRAEAAGLKDLRRELLAGAAGRTLEIGAGTGLNFMHYPSTVTDLVLTEPYGHMLNLLQRKVAAAERNASVIKAPGENLPVPDHSFDTVVGTLVLCTAADPGAVLQEIARVLRPGGQYLFLEHVLAPDPKLARSQNFIQPLWFYFGHGCHCNRETEKLIRESPLKIGQLRHGRLAKFPKVVTPMIIGRAVR